MMQAFWDSQLRFSAILPDFEDWLARMATESTAVAASERAAYGDHPRQWVEWAGGSGPDAILPVIFHGGYWRALDAQTHRFMMPAFQPHARAVANVEYRLMPEVRLGDVVADTQAALSLLCARFPKAQLVLIGHSAGAHLALSAMDDPLIRARTRGIIAISGVYDLAPVALSFLQDELHLTAEEIQRFTLFPSTGRPPVLYVNGSAETHEFLRGAALLAAHGAATQILIDGAHHMSLPHAVCADAPALLSTLFDLKEPT